MTEAEQMEDLQGELPLIVHRLACSRQERRLFSNLSLKLLPQSLLFVRGPNGAGKSTFLRALAGLVTSDEGKIQIKGTFLHQDPVFCQSQIAYLGHSNGLKTALSVYENVLFWAKILSCPLARSITGEALERYGLSALSAIPVARLSEGQKRRVALARLLVMNKPLWLLDEPSIGLDLPATRKLEEILSIHCQKGGCAVVVSHDTALHPHCDCQQLVLPTDMQPSPYQPM